MGFVLPFLPAVLSGVGAAAGVAGAITGAAGAQEQAKAASQAATYNAEVSQQNQQIANQNARLAAQSGEVQAAASSQKTRAQVGAIEANQAAGNIDVNTGSAVDVRSSAAELGQLDALTVRSNAAREAYGYQTQSTSFADQAALDQAQAANDITAGQVASTSTLLGGLGSAASNYGRYLNQNGIGSADGTAAQDPIYTTNY